MHQIFLFSMRGERRGVQPDRRGLPRGGRRCADVIRLALFNVLFAMAVPPVGGALPQY